MRVPWILGRRTGGRILPRRGLTFLSVINVVELYASFMRAASTNIIRFAIRPGVRIFWIDLVIVPFRGPKVCLFLIWRSLAILQCVNIVKEIVKSSASLCLARFKVIAWWDTSIAKLFLILRCSPCVARKSAIFDNRIAGVSFFVEILLVAHAAEMLC